ncbi:MAG: hypothetical protein ABIJ23_02140 [Candidatus Magasanikbacteria bacterium]
MARKKSEFLKAFGKMFVIFKALIDEVLGLGGSDEDIALIGTNAELRRELATTIMRYANKATTIVQKSWQQLLTACQQYWFNPDFTEARWPLEPVAPDESEWEVKEHFFSDNATGEEKLRRLAEMVKKGEIRFCGVRRAMEYVANHLDAQLARPLVVPVSAQDSDGGLCLPIFSHYWNGHRQRKLNLCSVSNRFYPDCAWLVLRKRS